MNRRGFFGRMIGGAAALVAAPALASLAKAEEVAGTLSVEPVVPPAPVLPEALTPAFKHVEYGHGFEFVDVGGSRLLLPICSSNTSTNPVTLWTVASTLAPTQRFGECPWGSSVNHSTAAPLTGDTDYYDWEDDDSTRGY